MEVELRYRGDLLGFHASREAAEAYAKKHHGWGRARGAPPASDAHVVDPESLTIEPRRPVSLFCRGNLVDTFGSEPDAERRIAEQIEQIKARALSMGRAALTDRAAYVIVRGTRAPPAS